MYVTNIISLRVQIWLDDRISPSPRYPDVWSMSQLCYCTTVDPPFHSHDPWAPRVQRQRQDQRRRSQKKPRVGGLKCHDFPLILLIRFLDHFRFYTFMMFLSVRRFHVGLQVSLIAGPSGGPNLQAHHLHIHIRSYGILCWLLILQMSHVTRLFNLDHRLYRTCACVLCHCWRITLETHNHHFRSLVRQQRWKSWSMRSRGFELTADFWRNGTWGNLSVVIIVWSYINWLYWCNIARINQWTGQNVFLHNLNVTFMYAKFQQLCPESPHPLLCDVGVKISSMRWRWNVPETFSTSSDRFVVCFLKKVVCLIGFRSLLDNLIWCHGERSVWYNKNEWSLLDVWKILSSCFFCFIWKRISSIYWP